MADILVEIVPAFLPYILFSNNVEAPSALGSPSPKPKVYRIDTRISIIHITK